MSKTEARELATDLRRLAAELQATPRAGLSPDELYDIDNEARHLLEDAQALEA